PARWRTRAGQSVVIAGLLSLLPGLCLAFVVLTPQSVAASVFAAGCCAAGLGICYRLGRNRLQDSQEQLRGEPVFSNPQASLETPTSSTSTAQSEEHFVKKLDEEEAQEEEPAEADEDVSLWTTRRHTPDGADCLEGITAAEFLSREKQTTVH